MSHDDDYLWDRSGPPDPDVEKLERSLSRFKHVPRTLATPPKRAAGPMRVSAPMRARIALAASIALLAGAALFATTQPEPRVEDGLQCNVIAVEGTTRAGSTFVEAGAPAMPLARGQEVETVDGARARIELASGIGHVEVAPNTRVRVEEIHEAQQRLSLEEGTISARVIAVPRLFIVDTPAARAVDLGCAYTLSVDSAGNGSLTVTSGRVELARAPVNARSASDGRDGVRELARAPEPGARSEVPAGASCAIRAGFGAGTPYWSDATEAMRAALVRVDFEGGGAAAIRDVIREARAGDALTLVHLLDRAPGSVLPALYARLAAISPPPQGVTQRAVLNREPWAIDAWRAHALSGEPEWGGADPKKLIFPDKNLP